jgi:two-component system, cell cycle sensor histidine kinase and response regulator CckA
MPTETRILILEDVVTDAELVERELRRANIAFTTQRVDTKKDFIKALTDFEPHIVLSDYKLPQFSGLEALQLLKEKEISVPFILITGALTEEIAVLCLREGVSDYILKANLVRLPSAVESALKKSETEKEKAEALEALRQSQEQLLQSQKLEAVGQLAGAVAHDFNNLLTAIMGFNQLSLDQLSAEDPLRRNLEEIRKASELAASLTRQLLALSRKQVMEPRILNLNSLVPGMERMLRRVVGENVEMSATLQPDLGNINADAGQMEQVIMNLVLNARDAMSAGGKLMVKTANTHLDESYARHNLGVVPGPHVMLAVSDTGIGIDEETREHIFEPFFTTKEIGKGTGLGLSTVYGIIKQSGGTISVDSEVGKGTTFTIYLPRVNQDAEEHKHPASSAQVPYGNETILLVEDADLVRHLAKEVLENNGYLVQEAASGKDALRIGEQNRDPIDLLLTDVVMPEMSGRELANRLSSLRPEMRVLYMSGYSNDAIVHHGVLDRNINFIQKPFSPEVLMLKVRDVLSDRRVG